jgi:2-C-methyl-D-erythritol 4-phosphate cytidylyltransferase
VVDDDAELVERLGLPVKVVAGEYSNIKITTAEDIPVLLAHLKVTVPGAG